MKDLYKYLLAFIFLTTSSGMYSQEILNYDFSSTNNNLAPIGRGKSYIKDGVLYSKGSYVCLGNKEWNDYSLSFKARAPKDAEQVQIWAGFRAYNRFDRYVVGIKGGLQDDIYLMRLGYMGTDEFLGVRPLGFHPVPGEWYKLRVDVCGDRIRVFVNDKDIPHIDVVDKNFKLAPSGNVTLGGGWIETEFDDLSITKLAPDYFKDVRKEEFIKQLTSQQKEEKRKRERSEYTPIIIDKLTGSRTEISLDGKWLFMPDYQLKNNDSAVATLSDDNDWHIISVPNFWNPIRIWLHGETMPSPNGVQPKGVSDTYYQQESERCENYTFDYRKTKVGWYRQWIELPNDIIGKNINLTFDAVSKAADIYINGEFAYKHIGMFGEINVDASKFFKPGKNLIAVKVIKDIDGTANDGGNDAIDFFYSSVRESEKKDGKVNIKKNVLNELAHGFYGDNPAGIWQPVKLTITSPLKINDVFIKSQLVGATFDVTVKNNGLKKNKFDLYTDIIDKETGAVLYSGLSLKDISFKPREEKVLTYNIEDLKPRLWSPQHPNLYDFKFRIINSKNIELDCFIETSGFRTFEVKDGFFYLNGHRYWLRGGNHIPFALAPNNLNLANTFMQLMKAGNIDVTRTHTTPWNKLWMEAADNNGIGISYEGTWPWLMIHSTPIPDKNVIEMWKNEFLGLLKKYRNHPSLLFWTVNNEMKFYDNDNDKERAMEKMRIISEVIKEMRKIDPTRPICFDSNYQSRGKKEKYGESFMNSIDDGDIDDMHGYYNWYDFSIFKFFNGEFQKSYKMPDKPLISQEMATGYPNNETGHPTRSYQLIHQNPMSLIGYECYDFANPEIFLNAQAFITGELAEALRRSNDKASGFMHFALLTWFRQVYDYKNIEPYPTYYALKRALQPVLVSAELWGRHFYSGEKLPTRFYIVNDKEDGSDLQPSLLRWEIQDKSGQKLISGSENIPTIKHYNRYYIVPEINLPDSLSSKRISAKLILKLSENGIPVSSNEYDITLAEKSWNDLNFEETKIISLLGNNNSSNILDFFNIKYNMVNSVKELVNSKSDICILSDLENCSEIDVKLLRNYQDNGGKLLLLNCNEIAKKIYPEYINGWITPTEGDIVFMERSEHPVFNDIDVMDLRYFNNNKREIPTVCNSALKINRNNNVVELAGHMKIHGYIDGGKPEDRIKKVDSLRGLTMIEIKDGNGKAIVSTMCTEKAVTDPIAGKLFTNLLKYLGNN